jgi:beta-lactamase class D
MAWKNNNSPTKYKHSQFVLAGLLFVLFLVISFIVWFVMNNISDNQKLNTSETTSSEIVNQDTTDTTETPQYFDAIALQDVVDEWTSSVSGNSSIVIADIEGNILATNNPSDIYFAASIYKIYVAYAGYQQVDAEQVDPDEIYINGYTRTECLDKMIRDSYSPCAEKLWNELGKAELTEQLKSYGINNTSMEAISTTAEDAGIMLARVARGEGLSKESQLSYLSSMKDQEAIYRRGLPSGFSSNFIVYNKVGWNELIEWHDTAIVELPDGRQLIVSVLSEDVGYTNISRIGTMIESALTN